MKDKFDREITGLRVSVTQRCNLSCTYCHREGEEGSSREMTLEGVKAVVGEMAARGVRYVKITGGEPFMREDIVDIISAISHVPGIEEVSMTTNGTMLPQFAQRLAEAGLKRVNIGCDSISSIPFKNTEAVLPGLLAAKAAGLSPIKLNMVVLKGINDHEVWSMVDFAGKHGAILQLIELIPSGDADYFRRHYLSLAQIEEQLSRRAQLSLQRSMHGRRQYYLTDAVVEVVRPHNRAFCSACNRMRVTSDGRLKPCLRTRKSFKITGSIEESFRNAIQERVVYCESING